jgi:transcription elongation factor Elf1
MTNAQKKAYLKRSFECPSCGCAVEGGPVNVENAKATQVVHCSSCMAQWEDVYTLVDVREIIPEGVK